MQILLAPLAVSVISGVLAALIVLVDAIVNNYGEVTITINGEKTIKVRGGAPLLFTLGSAGIFLPSACGGRGSCGVCKAKVVSDVGPHLPTEIPYMTQEEIAKNIRLTCQIKVKRDLAIEIPPELLFVKKFKALVEKIVDVTYDIKELTLKLIEPNEIEFKAGQYVQLRVPPYDTIKEPVERAYSISSSPSQRDRIELLIRLVPGGALTTYIFHHLKEGEILEFPGPFGEFYVRDTKATMICVAGGSGMAPIKSILFDLYEKGVNDREIWYFFGARSRKDLFYVEMFRELEEKWPIFHFIPALSDPLPEDEWDGEVGLITQVLEKYFQTVIPTDSAKEGYLCGSPGMIDAAVKVMTQCGVPEEKIYYDKFA